MKRNLALFILLLGLGAFFDAENQLQAQQASQQTQSQQQEQEPEQQPEQQQAQAQEQPAAEPDTELKPAEIDQPATPPADTDLILADMEEEPEDALRRGRFIPTEEISQDLGVSFPVDI